MSPGILEGPYDYVVQYFSGETEVKDVAANKKDRTGPGVKSPESVHTSVKSWGHFHSILGSLSLMTFPRSEG
jgi:hypothetical protein